MVSVLVFLLRKSLGEYRELETRPVAHRGPRVPSDDLLVRDLGRLAVGRIQFGLRPQPALGITASQQRAPRQGMGRRLVGNATELSGSFQKLRRGKVTFGQEESGPHAEAVAQGQLGRDLAKTESRIATISPAEAFLRIGKQLLRRGIP